VRQPRTLSSLILRYVLASLVVTMLLGFALYARVTRDLLNEHTEQKALAVAQAVAADGMIREQMASGDRLHLVQVEAEQIRRASGAAYVAVIDANGIRHSHPNPALIGQGVSEPLVALDGHSHVGTDHGSLGDSANGKAPLRAPDGRVIGEVSAGFLESTVSNQLWAQIPTLLLATCAALLAGILTSIVLTLRLKRMTFGLELNELTSLFQEREAMLHGIREGVVAFDWQGRLSVANGEARRLLALPDGAIGNRVDSLLPPGRLRDVLTGDVAGPDLMVLTDEHLLLVNRMPVRVRGRDVGSVVTLRDRTELEALLRELDSVTGLTDALRAQQHEFSNRLHVLSVLMEMGEYPEAKSYLSEVSATSLAQAEDLRSRIAPASLAALLLAKMSVAAERGIELTVTRDSQLNHSASDVGALLTIVGNLVDNAVDAVADSPTPRIIRVRLLETLDQVIVEVTDNGPGIPIDVAERVFLDGYTTKPAKGRLQRGLGLALVHRLVGQLGGSIGVSSGPSATFTVVLPFEAPRGPASAGAKVRTRFDAVPAQTVYPGRAGRWPH
jgi:two-component system, CitB family, sensor kinase